MKDSSGKGKRRKWPIILGIVLVLGAVTAIAGRGNGDAGTASTSPPASATGTPAQFTPAPETPTETVVPSASGPSLKYGELLDVTDNREAMGVVVVKAKIEPNLTNNLTVAQNYHNAVDLIANQGFSDCELQYWAVADMTDGSESKVISFTVPADIVGRVASGDVVATQLPDLVTDLWILPSLAN